VATNQSIIPTSWPYGMSIDTGTKSSHLLNSAYTFESAGDCWFCHFSPPADQTTGTLDVYVHVVTVTNTPSVRCEIRNGALSGEDADTPEEGGSALGTLTADIAITSSDDDTWIKFSFTGVTLDAAKDYFVIVHNVDGAPTTDHFEVIYRSNVDQYHQASPGTHWRGGFATDGFIGNAPTNAGGITPVVLKFDGGEIQGHPYMDLSTAASTTNYRGARFVFAEDMVVRGCYISGASDTNASTVGIFHASTGATLASETLTRWANRSGSQYWAPVTMVGGTEYDVVVNFSSADTGGSNLIRDMGEASGSLPADVLACKPSGWKGYVNGATLGSLTLDASQMWPVVLSLDDNPAIAGGSSSMLRRSGYSGGAAS